MTTRRRIFLAHAREDKPQIRKLYADLKSRGLDPWLDEVDLMPGQIWKVEIPKAIRQAGIFLACLSSRSVEKVGYVHNEFRLALSALGERPPESIYLVPVRLDDCPVPDMQIPDRGLSLQDIHWVDLWQEGAFDRLVATMELALGGVTLPQAASETVLTPISSRERKDERRTEQESREQASPAEAMLSLGSARKAGTVFRDVSASWCPQLVVVPRGSFTMGSPNDEEGHLDVEAPQREVRIAYEVAIGRYPISFEEFDRFAEASGRKAPNDQGWGRGRRPVVNVSWEDAQAYVAWLSEATGASYRLPSEAEWEYATRAGTTTRYWWGDNITRDHANHGLDVRRTTEVGSYPANSWGLHDVHGNVWEWVEDCWNGSYEGAPTDGSACTSGDCSRRVLRGGCWVSAPGTLRSAFRVGNVTSLRYVTFGFRVARAL